jgi:rhodanese-related sulfurtransferase
MENDMPRNKTRMLPMLCVAPALALAQIQVVDDACPKHAVEITSFASCDGDRVARQTHESTLRIVTVPAAEVPPLKRSDASLHVTSAEANRLLQSYPGQVLIVDIRSRFEAFYAGRPDVAEIHVPYREAVVPPQWDPAAGRPVTVRNENFVAEVKAALARHDWPEDSTLLLMCRSGELSAIAADALAAAGIRRVFTIVDGFEGDLSAAGRRDVNGWKNAGGRWTLQTLAATSTVERR